MSAEMQTKVQANPAQSFIPVQTGLLQRKSALCNTPGLVEDSGRDKEKLNLQRSSVDQAGTTTVPPIVHKALRSPGQPLDPATRAFMEPLFGHDFSKVSVHSTGPGMIQTKLKINEPRDIYEQEADMMAEQVMAMSAHPSIISAPPRIQRFSGQSNGQMDAVPASSGLGLVPVAIRPLSGQTRIQRQGGTYGLLQQWAAKRMYNDFIRNAEIYGLPVRFLRRVGRDYGISFGRSSRVCLTLNMMTLEEAVLQSASQIALTLPYGGISAIRTIYEEATHAYLDMVSDEPRFSRFIAEGVRHYQDARTTGGEITTDPWQVFQEAAGIYVGHRAAIWWSTFESLVINASIACSDPAAAGRLREMNIFAKHRDRYNSLMAKVVFGYSYEGGFLGIGSEPAYTTRAMSDEMKTFLDHELLEDRIPDQFEAVAGFQLLLILAGVTLSGPVAAPETMPAIAPAVQRQSAGETPPSLSGVQESVGNVLRSSGNPLDPALKQDMEQRFGHDFSRVRVHADAKAQMSAQAVNANAYTVGNDIVFASGRYLPGLVEGRRLLAHELTHVVQQRRGIQEDSAGRQPLMSAFLH